MIRIPPPQFLPKYFPHEEKLYVDNINKNIFYILSIIEKANCCVVLHNFSVKNKRNSEIFHSIDNSMSSRDICHTWNIIAGRSLCSFVYEFCQITSQINSDINKCNSVADYINRSKFKESNKLTNDYFGDFRKIRNAAAHGLENFKNDNSIDKHSVSGKNTLGEYMRFLGDGDTEIVLNDSFFNDTFIYTVDGKVLKIDVSYEVVVKLESIMQLIFESFASIPEHFLMIHPGSG